MTQPIGTRRSQGQARRRRHLLFAACTAAVALTRPAARGDEVTLGPVKDNTIYEEAGNRSNGAGTGLFAGATNDGNARRALLAFDVAGAVPAGATITSVRLTLDVTRTTAATQSMTVHRLLADWGEGQSDATGQEGAGAPASQGDATWTRRFFNAESWSTPGGDFAAGPSATQQVGVDGPFTWGSTPELIADVQGWVDAPDTNFGWLVRGNEQGVRTAKRFGSREAAAGSRPQLQVEFAPPAPDTPTPTPTPPPSTLTTTPTRDTPTSTATRTPGPCTGDCDGTGTVAINELIAGVNIALGNAPVSQCPAFDPNGGGTVTIEELIAAVNNALNGC